MAYNKDTAMNFDFTPPPHKKEPDWKVSNLSEAQAIFMFNLATGESIANSKYFVTRNLREDVEGGYPIGNVARLIREWHKFNRG